LNRRRIEKQTMRRAILKAGAGSLASALLIAPFQFNLSTEHALADTVNIVLRCNTEVLKAIRTTIPGPTVASRALAITHTCIYDAWAAYDAVAVGTRLGSQLRRPSKEHTLENKKQAISFAAYRALVDLFPSQTSQFDALMNDLGYNPNNHSINRETPVGIGNIAAKAVLQFRHSDGSNQLGNLHPGAYSDYTGYTPLNTPNDLNNVNHWQPLLVPNESGRFVAQSFTTPQWGRVIPFVLRSGSQQRPAIPPARYPTKEFLQQAEQILNYSYNLTDRQKVIVEYWKDGPGSDLPPGHWSRLSQFVSLRDHHELDSDVKMFFAVTNALMDAGIATWETKRFYDSVRPITTIRFLFKGQQVRAFAGSYKGTQLVEGQNWQPYIPTPSFPEYTSGHSAFSAAAAEVLKRFTGSDEFGASFTVQAGSSIIEPGAIPATDITLSWATFTEAANEAGLSRRYGGIHFELGDLQGRKLGHSAGALAWFKAQQYIQQPTVEAYLGPNLRGDLSEYSSHER
jgi:hypothetical protein